MIPYSVPPHLKIAVRDYTILDLGVDIEELRNSWKRCIHDYRLWVYNKTNKRYKFGHPKRQCFMAPGKEHFYFYTHFSGRWMCSVVDGASTYLDGHITRSVGRKADLRVRESRLGKNIYIEHSKPLPWSGRYTEVAPFLRVGAEALKWSFDILNRFVSETGPTPSQPDVARAAQIYVIHLAEAARFDSLFLENIYKYFLNTEHVGEDAIKKAQNWSVSCKDARKALDENEPVNDQIKMRAKGIFEDVRLIHRPNAGHGFFQLEKMPIQLGPDGPIFPEEDADAGGGAGNNNQGGGARGGERRERRRGRDQGPQDQGTSQDTSFLIEHFLPFEDDHQGKRSEHVEPTKNEINADAWLTVAVNEQEEAHRIIKTKGAEAEWLTVATNEKTDAHKIIQIEGTEYQTKDNLSSPSVASWGQAIMDRLRDSVLGFSVNVPCSLVEDAIREQCGKPESVLLEPECHALPWFIGEQVVNPLPLRPQQLDVVFETKNKDNVFPNVVASARYEAPLGNASDAFRKQSYTRFQNQAYAFDGEAEAVLAKSEATDEGIRMVLEFWKTEGSTEAAGLRIAKHIRALASLAKNANTMLLLDEARNPSATTDQTLKKHKHARRSCLTSGRSRQVVEAEEENGFADVPNKAGEMLVSLSVQKHDNLFTATPQPKLVV